MILGHPRYRRYWSGFAALGFICFMLQQYLPESFIRWTFVVGAVLLVISLSIFVVGIVADRREKRRG
jgi:hypothetical protein